MSTLLYVSSLFTLDVGRTRRAVASEDNVIKLVKLSNLTEVKDLVGHSEQAKSVDFSPNGKFVASASCDGSVKVWDIKNGEETAASWPCLPKDSGDSQMLCRLRFDPSGDFLALPGKHTVDVISTKTWKPAYTLRGGHSDKLVTVTAWAPNGKYLATADMDKQVCAYV